jgi:pimeloyl-ACP methyl ester carboxylesterase
MSSQIESDTITTKGGARIFSKEGGSAQPIVFSHSSPLSAVDWDAQMLFFLAHGFRAVAHERRGLGRSTRQQSVTRCGADGLRPARARRGCEAIDCAAGREFHSEDA